MKKMLAGVCLIGIGLASMPNVLSWGSHVPGGENTQTYFVVLATIVGLILTGSAIADILVEAVQ